MKEEIQWKNTTKRVWRKTVHSRTPTRKIEFAVIFRTGNPTRAEAKYFIASNVSYFPEFLPVAGFTKMLAGLISRFLTTYFHLRKQKEIVF